MSALITVHKHAADGRELLAYPARLLDVQDACMTVEAVFAHPEVEVGGLRIRPGDRMVESFYADRWYNVFAVFDSEGGGLKGWYCNITRPARFGPGDGHVYAEDLALDLVVLPDRRWQVLDEEEFAALTLTPEERRAALAALTELQSLALRRRGPFADAAAHG